MKKVLSLLILFVSLVCFSSCNSGNSGNGNSLVGTWREYRDDGDDYLLSTIVFNADGSGVYKVEATTNTQRVAFTWSQSGQSVFLYRPGERPSELTYNNGLLIEHSAFGEIVYKKR